MQQDWRTFAIAYGWNNDFETNSNAKNTEEVGRIISEEKNLYKIQVSLEECRYGEISGKFYQSATRRFDFPATGDWVCYTALPGTDRAIIQSVVPRKTCLYRRAAGEVEMEQILAANIDTAFVMTSMNADLNLRRLERYLVLCKESQVKPVIVLSKADLSEHAGAIEREVSLTFPDVDVHAISTTAQSGLAALEAHLKPGKTVGIFGSSGVGKSTLVNHLLGHEVLKTQTVDAATDKGRHTTTARYLFRLAGGALFIDTPGMRELQLFHHGDGLAAAFDDIASLALNCKFTNCQHGNEPACAITGALAKGTLSMERYTNYLKMQKELAFQERKQNKALASAEKDKWKSIHKTMRHHPKNRR